MSNKFPSRLIKDTCESFQISIGSPLTSNLFPCSLNVFNCGQQARSLLTFRIWFWLRISSTTCSPLTPSGTSGILFFDKSRTESNFRLEKATGKAMRTFEFKLAFLKDWSWATVSGTVLIRLLDKFKVSSRASWPIWSGITSIWLELKFKDFKLVNAAMFCGMADILLLDKSTFLRLPTILANSGGNSWSFALDKWKTPVLADVSTCWRITWFPISSGDGVWGLAGGFEGRCCWGAAGPEYLGAWPWDACHGCAELNWDASGFLFCGLVSTTWIRTPGRGLPAVTSLISEWMIGPPSFELIRGCWRTLLNSIERSIYPSCGRFMCVSSSWVRFRLCGSITAGLWPERGVWYDYVWRRTVQFLVHVAQPRQKLSLNLKQKENLIEATS